jgi:hypothetical protein
MRLSADCNLTIRENTFGDNPTSSRNWRSSCRTPVPIKRDRFDRRAASAPQNRRNRRLDVSARQGAGEIQEPLLERTDPMLIVRRFRVPVTPEGALVVKNQLHAAVRKDDIGGAGRMPFEKPKLFDERAKTRGWRVLGVPHMTRYDSRWEATDCCMKNGRATSSIRPLEPMFSLA